MARNPNIDDDTRARAMRFAADADMPKPAVTGRALPKQRIVSKKELEDSGLSLRDFLNKERGLTRRGMSKADAAKQLKLGEKPSTQEVADAKAQLGMDEPARTPRRTPEPLSSTRKPGTNINYENTDTSDMGMKRGGAVKGMHRMPNGKMMKNSDHKGMKAGGMTRGDGIAQRGKTKGRMV